MQESSAEPVIADPPPDWEKHPGDLLCPLCDYNLRGLTEPRCPECGYQFTWAGLMDDARNHHPWLFEHQKSKKIRAFFKTWFISQFPKRFWKAVQPTHKPQRGRLVMYCVVLAIPMIACIIGAGRVQPVAASYVQTYQTRQRLFAAVNSETNSSARALRARYGSVQAAINALAPYPPVQRAIQALWRGDPVLRSPTGQLMAQLGGTLLLWPWVTAAVLLIFRQTLKRARIKSVHVLRCAIYSCDVAPLLLLPTALILSQQIAIREYSYSIIFNSPASLTILAFLGALTYRLSVAYRRYLHFPHAVAVCISSQVIILLLMFYFLPWYIMW